MSDYPEIVRQLRHLPVKRLLTAMFWLEGAGQVLQGRALDGAATPSSSRRREGAETAWARRAHRRTLQRLDRMADELERLLEDPLEPRPEQPRCSGCGRKLGYSPGNFCAHCGAATAKGGGGSQRKRKAKKRATPLEISHGQS